MTLAQLLEKTEYEVLRGSADTEITEIVNDSRKVKEGDVVLIKSINSKAEVISVSKDGELTLKAGIMTVTAKEEDVYLLENEKPVLICKEYGKHGYLPRPAAVFIYHPAVLGHHGAVYLFLPYDGASG